MTPKQQIVALIPKLSEADVKEVVAVLRLAHVLNEAPGATGLDSDWLINGIISYLTKRGFLSPGGSLYALKHRDAYKTYLSKLPAVMAYLSKIEQQTNYSTRIRPKLAYLCASSLADLLTHRNYFSVSAMLSQIDKIPEAMEEAFPGYYRSGLYHYVLELDHT